MFPPQMEMSARRITREQVVDMPRFDRANSNHDESVVQQLQQMFSEIDLEIIEQVCVQFKNDIVTSIDKLL